MPNAGTTQPIPVRNAAVIAKLKLLSDPINSARLSDITSESKNANPKIKTMFLPFKSSVVNLLAFNQPFTKSKGEYQTAPRTKAEKAAVIIASQFKFAKAFDNSMLIGLV